MAQGIRSVDVDTERLRMHCLVTWPDIGIPVVLVHGNLSTALFFDELMARAPDDLRVVAPDMRGFGATERAPIDATRGLGDWSDDIAALVDALGIDRPVHLLGWSTGGGAVMRYALDRPADVASLTLIDPVSPFGFGATAGADGVPTTPDYAGSGGGLASPEFVERLRAGDRSADSDASPRSVMRAFYWHPSFTMAPDREDALVDEVLKTDVSADTYPGDSTVSAQWPGIAPGRRGILNALSGRWHDVSRIVDIDPKPPTLWIHGDGDQVVSDRSVFDAGTLGQLGLLPGWPGADIYPPQPMVTQIRAVLDRYAANGGEVSAELIADSSHGPIVDHLDRCAELIYAFIATHG